MPVFYARINEGFINADVTFENYEIALRSVNYSPIYSVKLRLIAQLIVRKKKQDTYNQSTKNVTHRAA